MLALMGQCFYWLNTLNPCEKTWVFPETGVPLNHPFIDGIFMIFHYKSSSYLGVPPFMEPPTWRFQSTEAVLNPEELFRHGWGKHGATILTNEPTSGASLRCASVGSLGSFRHSELMENQNAYGNYNSVLSGGTPCIASQQTNKTSKNIW